LGLELPCGFAAFARTMEGASMSLELVSAIASVGTFIVIAATAIAAIVQLHHIRGSNQIVALNEFREEFESPEVRAARVASFEIGDRINDPAARQQLTGPRIPDWFQKMGVIGRMMETLGGYVKHGIVSEAIVCDLWSPPILAFWEVMAPAIVVMRRTRGESLFENFEMLACLSKRWMARNPSSYPKNLPRIAPPDIWLEEDQKGAGTPK
jgi:hypothetical protein